MIPGLERFRDHFRGLESHYLLIGGAATELILSNAGLTFRVTKDLDIVLCVEALDNAFVTAFWDFVALAGYQRSESGTRRRRYYRFRKPVDAAYPAMVELFARRIDAIPIPDGVDLTPVPTGADHSSLSAILIDDELYGWLLDGRQTIEGVPIVAAVHLVALKIRAFLDLTERRERGESVDTSDIRKHHNDVFRLLQVVIAEPLDGVPAGVRQDVARFTATVREARPDLRNLKLAFSDAKQALAVLQTVVPTDAEHSDLTARNAVSRLVP